MDTNLDTKKIKNLFLVDWKNTSSDEIYALLNKTGNSEYEWSFYNCHGKNYLGSGVVNRYISYFFAVLYFFKNKKKYNNIIIWQQMIGFMLCLLPKFYITPKIIITSILYSPSRVKPGSFRMFLLKSALKKSDALLYFSEGMADDVKAFYPVYANKIFSTYLPITNNLDKTTAGVKLTTNIQKRNAVFSGGTSDRDFETVIKAFTNTDVPVTIVCTKLHTFNNPSLITDNITIVRGVSEIEYFSYVLSSSFVIVALDNIHSSCGQLLFTFCMKNSIPIIASDCYGTRDYISNNYNGILVPVKDDKAILAAYFRLVEDTTLREKIVTHSLEVSGKMNFDNYLQKINTIIHQIN